MANVNVACESKLRSVMRSSMHPSLGNWVPIGRAVVYLVWTAQASSAGINVGTVVQYHTTHWCIYHSHVT